MGRRIRRRFLRWIIRRWPGDLVTLLHNEADRVERERQGAGYAEAVGVVAERFNKEGQGD